MARKKKVKVTHADGTVEFRSAGTFKKPRRAQNRRRGSGGFAATLERAARDAGYTGYAHYLSSPRWRSLRVQVLNRDGHRCQGCGATRGLHVHHLRYALGREKLEDLTTLCGGCHRFAHGRQGGPSMSPGIAAAHRRLDGALMERMERDA